MVSSGLPVSSLRTTSSCHYQRGWTSFQTCTPILSLLRPVPQFAHGLYTCMHACTNKCAIWTTLVRQTRGLMKNLRKLQLLVELNRGSLYLMSDLNLQVTGYVACYEATGNATCKAAVINFIDILLANHSWSTGGSNSDEHWGQPLQMGHFLLDVGSLPGT